ncbi:hypothetical protein X777_10328 [Ooceraea biroi]|uniref:Uncharacterized protein n=1 Tax=Ooceraea biroi TaxID=2015173 RepID=A0A026W4N1_OOCBI|nr:hypothetical protein X777_10328 [Ooceraea biroi]
MGFINIPVCAHNYKEKFNLRLEDTRTFKIRPLDSNWDALCYALEHALITRAFSIENSKSRIERTSFYLDIVEKMGCTRERLFSFAPCPGYLFIDVIQVAWIDKNELCM